MERNQKRFPAQQYGVYVLCMNVIMYLWYVHVLSGSSACLTFSQTWHQDKRRKWNIKNIAHPKSNLAGLCETRSVLLKKISRMLFWLLGINRNHLIPLQSLRSCFAASESDCGLTQEHRAQNQWSALHHCVYCMCASFEQRGHRNNLFHSGEVSSLKTHAENNYVGGLDLAF